MRRFIALLLLCFLPFQFVLAASVDATEHATGAHHHHDNTLHSHDVAAEASAGELDANDSASRAHGECGACHFFHSPAMIEARAVFARAASLTSVSPNNRDLHHRSAVGERPERPNWSRLV
jgi:cytochrome c553